MLPDVADVPQNIFDTSDRYFTRFPTDAKLFFNPFAPISGLMHLFSMETEAVLSYCDSAESEM